MIIKLLFFFKTLCTFPVLVELNLSSCYNMSEKGIMTNNFSVLDELDLSKCRNMTEAGIMGFLNKAGESLKILTIDSRERSRVI